MRDYYILKGEASDGPYTLTELQDLFLRKIIAAETPVGRAGEPHYQTLSSYCDLSAIPLAPQSTVSPDVPDDLPAEDIQSIPSVARDENERESEREDQENEETESRTKHQLISTIGKQFNLFWECQREVIIARIKDADVNSAEFKDACQRRAEFRESIKKNALEYWRRSGVLKKWIDDLIWAEGDCTHKLKGDDEFERFDDLMRWIQHKEVAQLNGCYCWKRGREYVYVGKARAETFEEKFEHYRKSKYLLTCDAVRVLVSKHKAATERLERMLIFLYRPPPKENKREGDKGKTPSPVDKCWAYLDKELDQLMDKA